MKTLTSTFVVFIVFTGALFSQSTIIKLPTADSTSHFIVTDNYNTVLSQLSGNGEFYMLGSGGASALPALGSGPRMSWDPFNAAFRASYVTGARWDGANIGVYSFATGINTTASNLSSTAMGQSTTASGQNSTAMGQGTTASGGSSTAMGLNTIASGGSSTAMGQGATASGSYSTAMGVNTIASAYETVAMGYDDTASGPNSIAIGYETTASGSGSTSMGSWVSTNSEGGSYIIGDASTSTVTNSSAPNQMMMRFNGGYRLYSNSALTSGVYMNSGISGWTNISDRNKKQNFRPVDGEELLRKISMIPISEWSYKGTDPSVRYIGPMAQDFYAAFHLGGTDSLGINSISIDGVNMAAIQALEKRTSELQKASAKIAELEKQTSELQEAREKISALESSVDKLSAVVQTLVDEKKNVSMNVVEKTEH